jgi:hypothetical protein
MQDVIKKITDVITIVGPAIVAVLGVLQLTGVIPVAEAAIEAIFVVLGALSGVSSIVFNAVTKPQAPAA